jgi:hypothetical protein
METNDSLWRPLKGKAERKEEEVSSGFKIDKFKEMAGNYLDKQHFDLLKFSFPLDVGQGFQASGERRNHASANRYPSEVNKYKLKEKAAGALHVVDQTTLKHSCRILKRALQSG